MLFFFLPGVAVFCVLSCNNFPHLLYHNQPHDFLLSSVYLSLFPSLSFSISNLLNTQPTDTNLDAYIKEMKSHKVCDLARACECHYSSERVQQSGVRVHDIPFPDGDPPPKEVIQRWMMICRDAFAKGNPLDNCIAVHCVAGLGRAPVLVAIALIEFEKLEPLDAVQLIRSKRRGAINAKQLHYLQNEYKRGSAGGAGGGKGNCCVM